MKRTHAILAATAAVVLALGTPAFAETIIFSNNAAPGDSYTNAASANQGQALNSGWYYNNVRNSGTVGVTDTYARSGNGSVFFNGTQGPGGASSKADVEFQR